MSNQNIITYGSKISNVESVYFGPTLIVPPLNLPLSSVYLFLSRVDPWIDDNNPPAPEQTQQYLKSVFNNMFVAKKVYTNDISPVIERIDWSATNTGYDYYRDDINMFATNSDGSLVYKFYVKNRYNQVFKCLWNNSGQPSIAEPYFEPGTYGTNGLFLGGDGYKWKYMYTIDTGLAVKFMDKNWLPVSVGANTPNPLITSAGRGSIDVINLINSGSGYDPANSQVSITITGDGTGATATISPSVSLSGGLTDVIVTSPGSNYTYANVAITSATGFGAVAIAPTSPVGGHSYDPISELGCSHVMFAVEFNGSENTNGINMVPTDITYYQYGFVVNPTTLSSNGLPAEGSIYKTTTDLIVAPGLGLYMSDELVYQGTSLENASFIGTILSFDSINNTIKLINTKGTLNTNVPVFGNTSKTVRTLLTYSLPDFTLFSGYISYIENRSGIQRSNDGIEQFKVVLGY